MSLVPIAGFPGAAERNIVNAYKKQQGQGQVFSISALAQGPSPMFHRSWCYLVAHSKQSSHSCAMRFRTPAMKLVGTELMHDVFP